MFDINFEWGFFLCVNKNIRYYIINNWFFDSKLFKKVIIEFICMIWNIMLLNKWLVCCDNLLIVFKILVMILIRVFVERLME